ncbi:MAG TPA: glycosyltransferase family 87 protein [Chitinophagaceae bacterium]|nr:glycosyltransferase family 87 protein [Chitinophagaceae bacterium]
MNITLMNTRRTGWLFLIPLVLLMLWCMVRIPQRPLSDFAGYYFGGKAIVTGNFMQAYDMEALNFSIAAQGYKDVYVSYAPFPPFTALVSAPFSFLPVIPAKILFEVFSCLFFLFTLVRSVRHFALPDYILLLIPLVFFTPIANNILFGQSYLLLFCLLMEGYFAFKKGNVLLSSLLWALAILFKVFPLVLFAYLLLRKKYKAFLVMGVACVLLLLLSIGICGAASWQFYLMRIMPRLNAGELNHPFTHAFQSFFMLGKKLFVYDQLLHPDPAFKQAGLFVYWIGLFKALILSVCITFTFRYKEDDFLPFSLWMLGSMLLSPNGSTYSLVLLLLPFLALLVRAKNSTAGQQVFVLLITGVACNLSIHRFGDFPVLLQFPRLYLLLLLFLLLLWGKRRSFQPLLFAACAGLFILPSLWQKKKPADDSVYLLEHSTDLFTYDYTVQNGELVSFCWNGQKNEVPTGIRVRSFSTEGVAIRDNQVYYKGRQMTASADWKKAASILDGHKIVYLSDKGRGVCFYALRSINLGPDK